MEKLLARAIAIASLGFDNKVDKAGQPYILHCIRVMMAQKTVRRKILAILHDCIEDGVTTESELMAEGFPSDVIASLLRLTHNPEDDYMVYIRKLSHDKDAVHVKIADLEDNMSPWRMKGLTKKDFERMEKYHIAYSYLKSEIDS